MVPRRGRSFTPPVKSYYGRYAIPLARGALLVPFHAFHLLQPHTSLRIYVLRTQTVHTQRVQPTTPWLTAERSASEADRSNTFINSPSG